MSGFAGFVGRGASYSSEGDRRAVLAAMGAALWPSGEAAESYLDDDLAIVARRSGHETRSIRGGGPYPLVVTDGAFARDPVEVPDLGASLGEVEAGLAALDGAFSLLVWNRQRQRLLLARDRSGRRPLYYHEEPGLLIFASEPKLLLVHPECPREVEWRGGADPMDARATFLRRSHALPGGSYAVWNRGEGAQVGIYARPGPGGEGGDERGPLEETFMTLLREAVARVPLDPGPIAVSTEGGVASALILSALAARRGPRLDSLWLVDPSGRGPRLEAWRSLPRTLGLDVPTLTADDVRVPEELEVSLESLERLVRAADEPFLDLGTILRAQSYRRLYHATKGARMLSAMGGLDLFPPAEPLSRRVAEATLAHAGVPRAYRSFMSEAFRPGWEWGAWTDRESDLLRRSRELERQLPLEERIAHAQGVALETPLLDPHWLDLAYRSVRVADASARGLLADAALSSLPSDARRALLALEGPKEPEGWPMKVGRRILEGVLPAFLESYCERPHPMFSGPRMGQVYQATLRARRGSPLGARLVDGLLQGVTAAIFARHVVAP